MWSLQARHIVRLAKFLVQYVLDQQITCLQYSHNIMQVIQIAFRPHVEHLECNLWNHTDNWRIVTRSLDPNYAHHIYTVQTMIIFIPHSPLQAFWDISLKKSRLIYCSKPLPHLASKFGSTWLFGELIRQPCTVFKSVLS